MAIIVQRQDAALNTAARKQKSSFNWVPYLFILPHLIFFLLAALQDIPEQIHEAAGVDGANSWQTFWQVTFPMLRPVMLLIITLSIISSFNLFGQPFIMTNGGPSQPSGGGSTEPIMMRIYIDAFQRHFVGSAAAMSFVVAAIMILLSYLNFKFFSSRD